MVVDTSALLAILFSEPEGPEFTNRVENAATRLISAVGILEASIVVLRRKGAPAADVALGALQRTIESLQLVPEPVTPRQVERAVDVYRRFGKGFHPAALNFGDCFAYALAVDTGEPLLFKGTDFAATDVAVA